MRKKNTLGDLRLRVTGDAVSGYSWLIEKWDFAPFYGGGRRKPEWRYRQTSERAHDTSPRTREEGLREFRRLIEQRDLIRNTRVNLLTTEEEV